MDLTLTENRGRKIHPQLFALWLSLGSISMMFVALTSAYIVKKAAGNWLDFPLPDLFFYSAAVILCSSIALHGSYIGFKKDNTSVYRGLMVLAFILGTVFVILQYFGWQEMINNGIRLGLNSSGDFVFAISSLHLLHIVGGLGVLFVAFFHAFKLKHRVTEARKLRFQLTLTYWHFVDLLWLYILFFFVFTR